MIYCDVPKYILPHQKTIPSVKDSKWNLIPTMNISGWIFIFRLKLYLNFQILSRCSCFWPNTCESDLPALPKNCFDASGVRSRWLHSLQSFFALLPFPSMRCSPLFGWRLQTCPPHLQVSFEQQDFVYSDGLYWFRFFQRVWFDRGTGKIEISIRFCYPMLKWTNKNKKF